VTEQILMAEGASVLL